MSSASDQIVSTGNTPTPDQITEAVGTPPPVEKFHFSAADRKIDQGSFQVTLDQIDPKAFKNGRREMKANRIAEYRASIKQIGQLQNLLVSEMETGKFGIVSGYTRYESFSQNVFDPLIKKWNSEHGLQSTDPNFLLVTNEIHREMVKNAYPDDFDKEKRKDHNLIYIRIDGNVKDAGQALIRNLAENYQREDIPLMDLFNNIEDLITVHGMSAADVGKTLKKSAPAMSQFRRAKKLPAALRTLLVTPEDGEVITEADIVKLKEDVTVLVDELERRMGLSKDDDETVSFSHLREFSQRIVFPESSTEPLPITRVQALESLCLLVGADDKNRKLIKGKSPQNYTLWLADLKNKEAQTDARRKAKANPVVETPATDGTTGTAAAVDTAAGEVTGTVEGLAAQQDAAVSTGNEIAGVADKSEAGTPGAVAAEGNADAVVAPAPGVSSDAKMAELLGVDSDVEDDLVPESDAGATGRKTQSAPLASAKVKDVNVIHKAVLAYTALAQEEEDEDSERPAGLLAGALQAVAFGYQMIGLDAKFKKFQAIADEYNNDLETYITALEEYAESAVKKSKGLKPFGLERPIVAIDSDDRADVTAVVGDVDTDTDGTDDADTGPTAEELAGIEADMTGGLDDVGLEDLEDNMGVEVEE